MDETSGTNPSNASAERGPDGGQPAESPPVEQPGFRSRGRARRRARFLRRARELAYRDLGGLVYNLHRFGQRNDPLVLAKLGTLGQIDTELRAIEAALAERRPITVLREAGITACPRCAAIHGSEDRFCPNCGLPMSRHADLPIAGAPAGNQPPAGAPPTEAPRAPSPSHRARPPRCRASPCPPRPPRPRPHRRRRGRRRPPARRPVPAAMPASSNPATQRHPLAPQPPAAPAAGAGRSPAPPRTGPPGAPAVGAGRGSGTEEPTEIIRPQGSGS